jgi:hypothetical protein
MDVVTVLLYASAAAGSLVAAAWAALVLPRAVDTDAYLGIVQKLVMAGNVERARKLSLAAGKAALPAMVDAMLAAEIPYDEDVLIREALREAYDRAYAVERRRLVAAPPMLAVALPMVVLPAAIAVATGRSDAIALGIAAVIGGALALGAFRTARQILGATFERVSPVADALVAWRTGRAAG